MATMPRTASEAPRALVRAFGEHDLLTYATAVAYNGIFAIIPLALFGLGLCGVLGLETVWRDHLAPQLHGQVSADVFRVLDSSVRRVLGSAQVFWVTLGALLAVWEVSSAMRTVMTVLDRIYPVDRRRGTVERYAVSIALAAAVTVLVVLAFGAFELAPRAGLVGGILRWPLAALLLAVALAITVRWGPAERRPWHLVTTGTALAVVAWLVMSLLFGLYLRTLADYGSIFGNLATVIVAFEYAYLSAVVGMAGLTLDALAQQG